MAAHIPHQTTANRSSIYYFNFIDIALKPSTYNLDKEIQKHLAISFTDDVSEECDIPEREYNLANQRGASQKRKVTVEKKDNSSVETTKKKLYTKPIPLKNISILTFTNSDRGQTQLKPIFYSQELGACECEDKAPAFRKVMSKTSSLDKPLFSEKLCLLNELLPSTLDQLNLGSSPRLVKKTRSDQNDKAKDDKELMARLFKVRRCLFPSNQPPQGSPAPIENSLTDKNIVPEMAKAAPTVDEIHPTSSDQALKWSLIPDAEENFLQDRALNGTPYSSLNGTPQFPNL